MTGQGHLSPETFDLMAMQALPEAQAKDAQTHLGECTRCHARYEELVRDRQRFTQFVLPRTSPQIQERATRQRRWVLWRWSAGAVLATAVTAAAVAIVWPNLRSLAGTEPGPYLAARGGARFEVFIQHGKAVYLAREQVKVAPGDALRFRVSGADAKYLLVVSKDGAGTFSVYHPFGRTGSGELPSGLTELPGSVVLDEVLGKETLWAIFSSRPLDLAEVQGALSENRPLASVAGVTDVVTTTFEKVAP